MILDVGCGYLPTHKPIGGAIGLDIHKGYCDIVADAYHLPFQDEVFLRVYANHVLEHLVDPKLALKEMKRVGKQTTIIIPSPFNLDKSEGHIYTWNIHTLTNLLKLVFNHVETQYLSRRRIIQGRMGKYLPLINILLSWMGFHAELKAKCQ